MRIKITKSVPLSYFPPIGSIHEVRADRWTRDGAAYPIKYQGESIMVLDDECEILEDEDACEACQIDA